MKIYQLTGDERVIIEKAVSMTNVILVVCDFGDDIGCAVDYDALISEEFTVYLSLIAPLDDSRIKTI
jgi:hypothetical protein